MCNILRWQLIIKIEEDRKLILIVCILTEKHPNTKNNENINYIPENITFTIK